MGKCRVFLKPFSVTLLFFVAVFLFAFSIDNEALAQSSLGLGRSEQAVRPEGPFAGLLFWIQQQQQAFYKALTGALSAMRDNPESVWGLVSLSFFYGVFHAAGPGHGKAIISSYMLANEVAARRGILLSFASAFLQGLTAITVIGVLFWLLRGTGIKSSQLSGSLEILSYFLVMLLGIYLLWQKLFRTMFLKPEPGVHDHHHDGHVCDDGCGHLHAADPKTLEGNFGLREAWTAILAVGLRPCSGAIIVLTFAFLNGLYAGGVLSTFAMSLGTGITVATLALLAVGAKNTAMRFAGMQARTAIVHRVIEIGGALLVFVLGFLLFSAALFA